MKQLTSQARAGTPLVAHPCPSTGLHSKNAVLTFRLAGNCNAALARVDRGSTTSSIGNRASSDVVRCLRCVGIDVVGLRGASIAFLLGRGSAVAAVETAVLAEELVVRGVGLVSGSCKGILSVVDTLGGSRRGSGELRTAGKHMRHHISTRHLGCLLFCCKSLDGRITRGWTVRDSQALFTDDGREKGAQRILELLPD